jgi:hypothetical protein
MYWGDNEQQRKQRLEESLRLKKELRKGEKLKESRMEDAVIHVDNTEALEELNKQSKKIDSQQSEIRDLKHLLVQQNKVLEKILENQSNKVEVVYKTEITPEVKTDTGLPKLEEVDVKLIQTDGITSEGTAGDVKKGVSVKDKVEMLKRLKKGGL